MSFANLPERSHQIRSFGNSIPQGVVLQHFLDDEFQIHGFCFAGLVYQYAGMAECIHVLEWQMPRSVGSRIPSDSTCPATKVSCMRIMSHVIIKSHMLRAFMRQR